MGTRTLLAPEHLVRAAHQEGSHQDELGHERGDGDGRSRDHVGRVWPESGREHSLDAVRGPVPLRRRPCHRRGVRRRRARTSTRRSGPAADPPIPSSSPAHGTRGSVTTGSRRPSATRLPAGQAVPRRPAAAPGVPHDADGLVRAAVLTGGRPAHRDRARRGGRGHLFGAIDALRIPVEYLAELLPPTSSRSSCARSTSTAVPGCSAADRSARRRAGRSPSPSRPSTRCGPDNEPPDRRPRPAGPRQPAELGRQGPPRRPLPTVARRAGASHRRHRARCAPCRAR